ncbi:Rhodanese-related sulfurtransferase [Halocaridina rubra]|uniref:Ribosome biogenesis regulatory protein n=1 Tax=Halocaridina rubra TaxID=373956 RepID=A0AAN8X5D7_HALRR
MNDFAITDCWVRKNIPQCNMEEDTAARIQEILDKTTEEIKSVAVNKEVELAIDVGNLLVSDENALDEKLIRDPVTSDEYLRGLARDGVQALLTKIWELPSHQIDNSVYVKLPKPTTRLPREKPLPKGPILTKWEQYAREKGITRRKKEKKLWDETLKRWVPRYGYRKAQADKEKTWVLEVPGNVNPYEDQFEKRSKLKKEKVAKNEYQRLRNIARQNKIEVPKVGVTGSNFATPRELGQAMHHAKHATASKGKFQAEIPGEKKARGMGKKRKVEFTTGDGEQEKKRCLDILNKLDKPGLNLDLAINKQIKDENVDESLKRIGGKKYGRRSKMGGRHRTRSDYKGDKQGKGFNKILKGKKGKGKTRQAAAAGSQKKKAGKFDSTFKKSMGAGSVGANKNRGGKKGSKG